jgi:hypothetical protein
MRAAAILTLGVMLVIPAIVQATETRSFTGSALRYTPSRVTGCDVLLTEAAAYAGQVTVTLRNAGTSAVEFTLSGELAGNGQRAIGTVTTRLPRGQDVRMGLMRAYAGSLASSVLTLRGAACALMPG